MSYASSAARAVVAGAPRWRRALAAGATLLAAAAALLTLRAAFCAFTWGRFGLVDYGRYVNAVWNSGHGRPWRMLVDQSYLDVHLSFSLALLGPFFRVWDHPFLLSVLQWASAVGGVALLARVARRGGLSPEVTAALAFAALGHPYLQAVLLSEFHGVGLYPFLLAWLYHALSLRRSAVWLPLGLLLGLREDAGLVAMPMLLYFAARDRWPAGGWYAAAAGAYVAAALSWIFPALGGAALLERRQALEPAEVWRRLHRHTWPARSWPVLRAFFPALPLLAGGWLPLATIPLAALLLGFASPHPQQFGLRHHYPAALLAGLFPAMFEAVLRPPRGGGRRRFDRPWVAAWLVAVTLSANARYGFLPGGPHASREYRAANPDGRDAVRAAAAAPREGILVCAPQNAGFCANRADLLTWRELDAAPRRFDLVFFRLRELAGPQRGRYRELLSGREFGLHARAGDFVVLARGADPAGNAALLAEAGRSAR